MMGGNQRHMGMSMLRHRYFMHSGIPDAYRDARNPLQPTEENVAAGRLLYGDNCATCHGPQGYGDGPAVEGLNPPPANIAALARMPMASDGYLMWTLSEGGKPIGSAMPSFDGVLTQMQRWQVITVVRAKLGR
jgi:mono/diheme cytochrome c family protein